MANEDMTFCGNQKCKNMKCDRNPKKIKQHWLDHSYAMFTDCEYWEDVDTSKD